MKTKKICVVGEGAWGTAWATMMASKGYQVNLWCYHADYAQEINKCHTNTRYMPELQLSPLIYATTNIHQATVDVDLIFSAIPVQYMRSVYQQFCGYLKSNHIVVSLSKGIEKETLLLPTAIVQDVCGKQVRVCAISGPSFAYDFVRQQPTGLVISSTDLLLNKYIADTLCTNFCIPDVSTDMVGVQLCGAFKNVIALGVGMLDSAGYLDNTKALFITQCIEEMSKMVHAAGGKKETVYGLAGIGDLMLSVYGKHGRNMEVGRRIGRGQTLSTIIADTGCTPEGVNTVASIYKLAKKLQVNAPFCQHIHDLIYTDAQVVDIIQHMRRNS